MDGTGEHYAKQSGSDADRHCTSSLTCGLWEERNRSKMGNYWGCGRRKQGGSEREVDGVHMIKVHGLTMVEPLLCTVENAKRDQLARLPSQAKASRLGLQRAAGASVSRGGISE